MILYYLTSGSIFFIGLFLIIVGVTLDLWKSKWLDLFQRLIVCCGVIATFVSTPPLPVWVFLIAIIIFVVYIWINIKHQKTYPRFLIGIALAITCLILAVLEFSHWQMPAKILNKRKLYILGDSLTAGIGDKNINTYPNIINRTGKIEIVDLAIAGAQIHDGLKMVDKISEDDATVLIELGGNDWRINGGGKNFRKDLQKLLSKVCNGKRMVIMFELPFPPFHYKYTYAQRELAAQYNVILIPKKVLAKILFYTPNATTDGIHMSQIGHTKMAKALEHILFP